MSNYSDLKSERGSGLMTERPDPKTSVGKKVVVGDMEFVKMLEEIGEQSHRELGNIGKRKYRQRDHKKMQE